MRRDTRRRLGWMAGGLLALLLVGSAGAAEPAQPLLRGTVSKVNDGDSIEVQLDSGRVRVRLSGVDTPEFDQPYGAESSAALKTLLPLGTAVELEVATQDAFQRMVAVVWRLDATGRVNINETLLRDGHAWAYRRYLPEARFCDLEQAARERRAGLWAQPVSAWVYPPEWRLLKNGEIRTLPVPYEETREKCLAVMQLAGKGNY